MKKLLILPLFFSFSCFAQPDSIKSKNRWVFGVGLSTLSKTNPNNYNHEGNTIWDDNVFYNAPTRNTKDKSFSLIMIGKYAVNKNNDLRLKIGLTKLSIATTNNDLDTINGSRTINDASKRQFNFHIAPGIIWNLHKERFTFFAGFEVPVNIDGISKVRDYIEIIIDSINTISYTREVNGKVKNGWSVGIGNIAGVSFKVTDFISLESSISISYLYNKYGGKDAFNLITTGTNLVNKDFVFDNHYVQYKTEVIGSLTISANF